MSNIKLARGLSLRCLWRIRTGMLNHRQGMANVMLGLAMSCDGSLASLEMGFGGYRWLYIKRDDVFWRLIGLPPFLPGRRDLVHLLADRWDFGCLVLVLIYAPPPQSLAAYLWSQLAWKHGDTTRTDRGALLPRQGRIISWAGSIALTF